MPGPKFMPIDHPDGLILVQSEHEFADGHQLLFPQADEHDGPEVLVPLVEAYSMVRPTILNIRMDDYLRQAIDSIGATYKLTRSECIRRLLYAVTGDFPGYFEEVHDTSNRGEGAEPLRQPSGEAAHAKPIRPEAA